jgi:hypothetical protein
LDWSRLFLLGLIMDFYQIFGSAAVGAGAVGVIWFLVSRDLEPKVIKEVVAEKQIEVEAALTDQDLLKVPCSKDYLSENGESLCREMYCYLMTRGAIGNKASAQTCESITNAVNKALMIKICANPDEDKRRSCIELFDRRF